MNNFGFYIQRLVLSGYKKKNAELILAKGLNVIAGASNTGKSYIFQCLNFVFGGKEKPKPIKESEGYSEILLEIVSYSGETITLKRNLSDEKMYLYHSNIDNINSSIPKEIINKHDKDDPNNISTILLLECGAEYKNLSKNKSHHTVSFSFRDFTNLIMLDELKIIEDISPIYDGGGYVTRTKNKSAFKTIITGVDDTEFKGNKQEELNKAKIQAKIELIDEIIIKTQKEVQDLKSTDKIKDSSEIEEDIQNIKKEINNRRNDLGKIEENRKILWEEILKLKNEKIYFNELGNRFELLKENYESDIQRLEFIDESEFYLNQLVDVNCPLCNSKIESIPERIDIRQMQIATTTEREKINLQLEDLLSAIDNLKLNSINLYKQIEEKSKAINETHEKIESELKPVLLEQINKLNELITLKEICRREEYSTEKIEELNNSRVKLVKSLSSKKLVVTDSMEISDTIYKAFADIVKDILLEWKLSEDIKVEFDVENMDLKIDGNIKKTYGKGYTAIINSAFVIAVMIYTIQMDLPHPRIVILDSPLTTYKGNDKGNKPGAEVNEQVKKAFYKYLSQLENTQIIVLDNIEPQDEIKTKITYYHFSGNNSIGRHGFIPINK